MQTLGENFAKAIAAKDEAALRAVLSDAIDFQALTPGRHWQAASRHRPDSASPARSPATASRSSASSCTEVAEHLLVVAAHRFPGGLGVARQDRGGDRLVQRPLLSGTAVPQP